MLRVSWYDFLVYVRKQLGCLTGSRWGLVCLELTGVIRCDAVTRYCRRVIREDPSTLASETVEILGL